MRYPRCRVLPIRCLSQERQLPERPVPPHQSSPRPQEGYRCRCGLDPHRHLSHAEGRNDVSGPRSQPLRCPRQGTAGEPSPQTAGCPRHRPTGQPLSNGSAPNELWCTDFKGEFKLGNGRYCYPLTVTDHASRYLLLCEALESTRPGPRQSACLAVPSCFTTSGAEGHRPYVGLSNLARTPG